MTAMTKNALSLLLIALVFHLDRCSSSIFPTDFDVIDETLGGHSSLDLKDCKNKKCCNSEEEKVVVCYFTDWAWYKEVPAKFTPSNINASLCTHINYAFATLNASTLTISSADPWADIDNKFYEQVVDFIRKGLKVLISIGGWNNSAGSHWSQMFTNANTRAKFISSVLNFMAKYGFSGLDLDYEYPGCPQGNKTAGLPTDKENFNKLVSELKAAFNGKYLLTVAVAAGQKNVKECYNMDELWKLVDWVNIMAYDYYSYLDGEVGANAPLYGTATSWGVFQTLQYFREVLQCPGDKLVLGVPFYGKSYTLDESSPPQFGVPVSGPGAPGTYTKSAGTLSYYEVCLNQKSGWNTGLDKSNDSYAWHNTQFVSFDGVEDIKRKSCLINKHFNLKGAMFWALDLDDFANLCGGGTYPLLTTLNQQLRCL